MFNPNEIKSKPTGDTTTGVFVSLYLIVLAFFIVMNVISNQVKSKVSASVSSVNDTFKAEFIDKADQLEAPKDKTESTPNLDFQRSIIDALDFSELELSNRHVSRGGSQLRVDINVDDVFLPNSAILNQKTAASIEQLIILLGNAPEGEMREFAFFFGYGRSTSADEKDAKRILSLQRAGTFARHLQSLNAPQGAFTTGLRATDEAKITAVFRTSDIRNFPIILERMDGATS